MLYEKQLGLLRGISHSARCCWRVKSFLFSFCFYMIKSDDTLIDIQFRQPGETVMRMLMHPFKLTKELNLFFYHLVMSSLARRNRFYINTKIYYSAYWASPPIGIFFPYKHPARKKYVTLGTFFIQATYFQFCHNYLKPICF